MVIQQHFNHWWLQYQSWAQQLNDSEYIVEKLRLPERERSLLMLALAFETIT